MSSAPVNVTVVTGAARGIGLAIARTFLQHGHALALLDIDGPTLTRSAAILETRGEVLAIECDAADPAQVTAAVDRIRERFERIDALINNAGIAVFKPLLETSYEEWSRVLDVNLSGPFICTQACAPVMLAGGGGASGTGLPSLRRTTDP